MTPERPSAPPWLADDEKKVFDDLAGLLFETGVVARLDQMALAHYAEVFVLYRREKEFVRKQGTVYAVRDRPRRKGELGTVTGFRSYPQMKHVIELSHQLLRMAQEFGLTPSARARLGGAGPSEELEPDKFFGTGS